MGPVGWYSLSTPRHSLCGCLSPPLPPTVLASGQVAGMLDDLPSCAELVPAIVAEAVEHLQKASGFIA